MIKTSSFNRGTNLKVSIFQTLLDNRLGLQIWLCPYKALELKDTNNSKLNNFFITSPVLIAVISCCNEPL